MYFAIWTLVIGALLIAMALSGALPSRLPVSTAMLYLAAGFGLGPAGWAMMAPDPLAYSAILERAAEVAVLISLFAVGLKLGLPLSDKRWRLPVRLAVVSMTITVGLIAAIGMLGLGLLGLLGLHDLGTGGWRWLALDVLWAISAGLLIGGALGTLVGRLVVYLRSRHKASVGRDEFLALGLIALSYGLAVLSHSYGFLAVLAAGVALQRVKEQPGDAPGSAALATGLQSRQAHEALATDAEYASAYLTQQVQGFNEQPGCTGSR